MARCTCRRTILDQMPATMRNTECSCFRPLIAHYAVRTKAPGCLISRPRCLTWLVMKFLRRCRAAHSLANRTQAKINKPLVNAFYRNSALPIASALEMRWKQEAVNGYLGGADASSKGLANRRSRF